ncbi:hypothetical protein ACVOMS_26470 [Bradyrhizobium guangxiense]
MDDGGGEQCPCYFLASPSEQRLLQIQAALQTSLGVVPPLQARTDLCERVDRSRHLDADAPMDLFENGNPPLQKSPGAGIFSAGGPSPGDGLAFTGSFRTVFAEQPCLDCQPSQLKRLDQFEVDRTCPTDPVIEVAHDGLRTMQALLDRDAALEKGNGFDGIFTAKDQLDQRAQGGDDLVADRPVTLFQSGDMSKVALCIQ